MMQDDPRNLRIRSSFTFQVACDEISRLSSQLAGLASQKCSAGDSGNSAQGAERKKRKGIQALFRKIGCGKKREGKSKRANRAPDNARSHAHTLHQQEVVDRHVEEMNTTFATEDLSMETCSDSPLLDSLSARKRKRFAGIWDANFNEYMGAEYGPPEKRARVDKNLPGEADGVEEDKENLGPLIEVC